MSFVLDALLKAQAQRTRGGVPTVRAGLSEGPVPPVRRGRLAGVPRWGWIVLVLVVIALVALGLLAWQLAAAPAPGMLPDSVVKVGPDARAPPAPLPVAGPAPSPLPPPVTAPLLEPATPSAQVALPPQPAQDKQAAGAAQVPQPVPPAPAPAGIAVPAAAPRVIAGSPVAPIPAAGTGLTGPTSNEAVAEAPPVPGPDPKASAPQRAMVTAAPDSGPVPARQALPADLQSQLPPLALSGTVYASDPVQRMAIVNGEVWRQGDQIAPGLVLEEIRRKDAVLSFKGQRFSISP